MCQAGYWKHPDDLKCYPCPLGTYGESHHDDLCYRCPLGTITLTTGATSRSSCFTGVQPNMTYILLYFIFLQFVTILQKYAIVGSLLYCSLQSQFISTVLEPHCNGETRIIQKLYKVSIFILIFFSQNAAVVTYLIQLHWFVQSAPLGLIVVVILQNPALIVHEIKPQPKKDAAPAHTVVRFFFEKLT